MINLDKLGKQSRVYKNERSGKFMELKGGEKGKWE
jgi:hypothetical protein